MIFSKLCMFNGGCIGCCGDGKRTPKRMAKAVKVNTMEFKKFKSLVEFRDRADDMDLRDNVCRNAVEINKEILCPLHPALNEGKDLRVGHCDIKYFCKTAKVFNSWTRQRQISFCKFLEAKNVNQYISSLGLDSGSYLKEFRKLTIKQ